MNNQFDDGLYLLTLERMVRSGWIEYEPGEHIRIYRTLRRQVIPRANWRFDLLENWQPVRVNVNLPQAVRFLECE